MKKVKFIIVFVLLLNIMIVGVVYAAAKSYTSTLSISPGSYHQGTYRDYTGSYHGISISIDEITESGLEHKLVVLLGNKKLLGGFSQKDRKVISYNINTCYMWKSTVNVGKSNVSYGFRTYANCGTSTGGTGSYYSGVNSNQVVMTSRTSA